MLIPLIDKDLEANDFTCRDGEIEGVWEVRLQDSEASGVRLQDSEASGVRLQDSEVSGVRLQASINLTAEGSYPTANIRIPLEPGDKEKANLLLSGEISRVDPATAERLTQAILLKSAELLLDLSTDLRRQGLFILPFRYYTKTVTADGKLTYPSPMGVALPTDFPPHPEITAAAATDDALTLALRFPVRPHRLNISPAIDFPNGHSLQTFISYPLYIPDPKEIRGSIGSVKSAVGGTATGIRFAFLSSSAIKASVAAPEKYYEFVGNERTGYRLSSKSAGVPDYSCYSNIYGYVPPFSRGSMIALGADIDEATDPMDWIADWVKVGDGYLPTSLPYMYRYGNLSGGEGDEINVPEGFDAEELKDISTMLGMPWILLTRPMTLCSDNRSRRKAEARGIREIQVHGLPESGSVGMLYGSNDCRHWEAMRCFDPRQRSRVCAPKRLLWRVLLFGDQLFPPLAVEIN